MKSTADNLDAVMHEESEDVFYEGTVTCVYCNVEYTDTKQQWVKVYFNI